MNTTANISQRMVCYQCVRENFLSDLIRSHGQQKNCSYCLSSNKTWPISDLCMRIEEVFRNYFARTQAIPHWYTEDRLHYEAYGAWDRPGRELVEILSEIMPIDENYFDEIISDILTILEESPNSLNPDLYGNEKPFDYSAHYEHSESSDFSTLGEKYHRYEKIVIEQSRFFSPESRKILHSLFMDIDNLKTKDGHPVLVEAGPDLAITGFFRARVFQDEVGLKKAILMPSLELGPPPSRQGRAGRLNGAGISIFYGANTAEVALSEVRPPVGSRVVIAWFELQRKVRLLDIDALRNIFVEKSSPFDPDHLFNLQRAAFLESFSSKFTKPVMPDNESLEYLPTQSIADYLANEVYLSLDGLLYASPQSGHTGRNVALFYKASRITSSGKQHDENFTPKIEIPEDNLLYLIVENVAETEHDLSFLTEKESSVEIDDRQPTLRIDENSLAIHYIESINVQSKVGVPTRCHYKMGAHFF